MRVLVCLKTSTYVDEMVNVVSSGMHSFVRCTSWWRFLKSPLMLGKKIRFLLRGRRVLLLIHLAQCFSWRACRCEGFEEDRRV